MCIKNLLIFATAGSVVYNYYLRDNDCQKMFDRFKTSKISSSTTQDWKSGIRCKYLDRFIIKRNYDKYINQYEKTHNVTSFFCSLDNTSILNTILPSYQTSKVEYKAVKDLTSQCIELDKTVIARYSHSISVTDYNSNILEMNYQKIELRK